MQVYSSNDQRTKNKDTLIINEQIVQESETQATVDNAQPMFLS